jgi:hypothetical protein
MSRAPDKTGPSWLVTLLVALLVLGHACELPAFTDPPPATATHDHAEDHHADESKIVCDPVSAASTTHAQAGPSLAAARAIAIPGPAPLGADGGAAGVRARSPSRPALFLLHAALLI